MEVSSLVFYRVVSTEVEATPPIPAPFWLFTFMFLKLVPTSPSEVWSSPLFELGGYAIWAAGKVVILIANSCVKSSFEKF